MESRYSPTLLTVLCLGHSRCCNLPIRCYRVLHSTPHAVNVWGGFSTAWYFQLLHNRQLLQGSTAVAGGPVSASTAAVLLGPLAAIALVRSPGFAAALLLTGMVNAPLVMPEDHHGITQLLLFVSISR